MKQKLILLSSTALYQQWQLSSYSQCWKCSLCSTRNPSCVLLWLEKKIRISYQRVTALCTKYNNSPTFKSEIPPNLYFVLLNPVKCFKMILAKSDLRKYAASPRQPNMNTVPELILCCALIFGAFSRMPQVHHKNSKCKTYNEFR